MANEKRLISADDFKKVFYVDDDCDEIRFGVDGKVFVDFKAVQRAIDEAPTVDAVEVEDKELLKAIKLLIKQYGHSKASEYVHSPC